MNDEMMNYDIDENKDNRNSPIPPYRKYTMGIEEAARYYEIGTKKLRQIIAEHPEADFYIEIGRRILLKRRQFEMFLDGACTL